jgi:hypothetical protein
MDADGSGSLTRQDLVAILEEENNEEPCGVSSLTLRGELGEQ